MKNKNGMFENNTQKTAESVLILHVLSLIGEPVGNGDLIDIMMGPGLVNYFTVSTCFSELLKSGDIGRNLDSMGKAMYYITGSGQATLSSLRYMISGGLGAAYESYIAARRDEIMKRNRVDAVWTTDAKGNYFVHCYVKEGMTAIIDITVPVADKNDAEYIVAGWKESPSEKYIGILRSLLDRG